LNVLATVDPLPAIEKELSQFTIYPVSDLPSFTGGGVGYIGYDCISAFEKKIPTCSKNTLNLPVNEKRNMKNKLHDREILLIFVFLFTLGFCIYVLSYINYI
jgi:hypothetical protein